MVGRIISAERSRRRGRRRRVHRWRRVSPGEERRECGGAAGLDDETKDVPQHVLRAHDVVVFDQDDAIDVLLRDRKHQFADAARRERVGGDAAGWRIDGSSGLQRSCSVGAPTGSTPITRVF